MRQKIIATGAGLFLAGMAAAGAYAAQDSVKAPLTVPVESTTATVTATDTGTATVTETVTDTSTPDATQTDTPTPGATDTSTPGATDTTTPGVTDTATPGSSETPTPEATNTSESGGERDIKGVPTDNPGRGHHEGLCIKTTPSGNQVRVPCQAVKGGGSTPSPTPTP